METCSSYVMQATAPEIDAAYSARVYPEPVREDCGRGSPSNSTSSGVMNMQALIPYTIQYRALKGISERIAAMLPQYGPDDTDDAAWEVDEPASDDTAAIESTSYFFHGLMQATEFARRNLRTNRFARHLARVRPGPMHKGPRAGLRARLWKPKRPRNSRRFSGPGTTAS